MQEFRVYEHALDGVEPVDDLSCLDTPFDGWDTQVNLPQVGVAYLLQILKFTLMQILTLKVFNNLHPLKFEDHIHELESHQHLVYIIANVP